MKYPNTRWLKNSQFVVSCTSMDQESGDSWSEWFWLRITHEVAVMKTTRVIFWIIFRVITFIFWPSHNLLKAWPLRDWESASQMVHMTVGWRPQFVIMWNSALGCLNVLKTWQLLSLEKMTKKKDQCLLSLCHTVTSCVFHSLEASHQDPTYIQRERN